MSNSPGLPDSFNDAPAPSPKSGFWGVLKNKILPTLARAGQSMGLLYGSPGVASGIETANNMDVQQQQLKRQGMYDVPALAKANAEVADIPLHREALQTSLDTAKKQNAVLPGSIDEMLDIDRKKKQIAAGYTPFTGSFEGEPGMGVMTGPGEAAPIHVKGSELPVPFPMGTPSNNRGGPVPEPVASAMPEATTPHSNKPQITPVLKYTNATWKQDPVTGKWVQTTKDQFGRLGPEFAGTPTGMMPSTQFRATLKAYTDAGLTMAQAVNKYNENDSRTTNIRLEKDVHGNIVSVPVTSEISRQTHGAVPEVPGVIPVGDSITPNDATQTPQAPIKPFTPPRRQGVGTGKASPVISTDGTALHVPLSAGAKTTLSQIDGTQKLLDSVYPTVKKAAAKGSLWDSAQQRIAWAEYTKLGVLPKSIDPLMGEIFKIMPTIAQLQIVGGGAYMKGTRAYQFIEQIQQHLPNPALDTPEMMVDKFENLKQTLPLLKEAIYESESIDPAAMSGSGNPSSGNASGAKAPKWNAKTGRFE